jgi:hypothetical protein
MVEKEKKVYVGHVGSLEVAGSEVPILGELVAREV